MVLAGAGWGADGCILHRRCDGDCQTDERNAGQGALAHRHDKDIPILSFSTVSQAKKPAKIYFCLNFPVLRRITAPAKEFRACHAMACHVTQSRSGVRFLSNGRCDFQTCQWRFRTIRLPFAGRGRTRFRRLHAPRANFGDPFLGLPFRALRDQSNPLKYMQKSNNPKSSGHLGDSRLKFGRDADLGKNTSKPKPA